MSIRIVNKTEGVITPQRSTEFSAGYDVFSNKDIEILAGQEVNIALPAGIEFNPEENKVYIFLRSSMGMNNNLRLIRDAEIVPSLELEYEQANKQQFVTLRNVGEADFTIKEGLHYLQYIIVDKEMSYLPFTSEEIEDLKGEIPVALSIKETKTGVALVLEEEVFIEQGRRVKLPSGLRFRIKMDSYLEGRVPQGEKRFSFSNGTTIIDSDYVYAENTGHCYFSLDNITDEDLTLSRGTAIVELMSVPYYKAENEIVPTKKRTGGIGSTTEPKEDRWLI